MALRVKYNIEYNSGTGLYRLPKAPELIKIANVVAEDVFYDTSSDNAPEWVDLADLQYDYEQQIFFDVTNEKNMFFTSSAISGSCLNTVYDFIKYTVWLLDNGFWNDNGVWADDETWND